MTYAVGCGREGGVWPGDGGEAMLRFGLRSQTMSILSSNRHVRERARRRACVREEGREMEMRTDRRLLRRIGNCLHCGRRKRSCR